MFTDFVNIIIIITAGIHLHIFVGKSQLELNVISITVYVHCEFC